MRRRHFLKGGAMAGALAISARSQTATTAVHQTAPEFELEEATLVQLQEGMTSGKYTARSIVERYLSRIAQIDKAGPAVNADARKRGPTIAEFQNGRPPRPTYRNAVTV